MSHLRWKKEPKETGLRAVCVNQKLRDSHLHNGEEEFATVSCLGHHWTGRDKRWFWFASGKVPYMNTCKTPVDTEAEAKKRAMEYVKQHLKETP